MAENNLTIVPMFASPLLVTEVADSGGLNTELEQLILARETEQHRSRRQAPHLLKGVFESEAGVLEWQEPAAQRLRKLVFGLIGQLVGDLSVFSQAEMASMLMVNQTRFQVTRHGGAILPHNHPMSAWSMHYTVSAGEETADHPDSGVLRFLDTRTGCNMYLDPFNGRLRAPFGFGHLSVRPRAGQLVVCPSYVMREVSTYLGQAPASRSRLTCGRRCAPRVPRRNRSPRLRREAEPGVTRLSGHASP
jgi:hypothetical protein